MTKRKAFRRGFNDGLGTLRSSIEYYPVKIQKSYAKGYKRGLKKHRKIMLKKLEIF